MIYTNIHLSLEGEENLQIYKYFLNYLSKVINILYFCSLKRRETLQRLSSLLPKYHAEMDETSHIKDDVISALRGGHTILYPTDTIWGVGCDATNDNAIEKLYQIKERDHSKSMLILVSKALARDVFPATSSYWSYLIAPRPTTVIFPKGWGVVETLLRRNLLSHHLLATDGSIGIRVPQHEYLQQWLTIFERPVVSTSANLSGQPSPQSYKDISPLLKERIDYCVPFLEVFASQHITGSRILKLVANQKDPLVIRE